MNAADPHTPSRGAALLAEHVAALDVDHRPTARERLEGIIGASLARMLVGALAGRSRRRHREVD